MRSQRSDSCLDRIGHCSVAAAAAADTVVIPTFVEETASAGIDSTYAGEWEYMVGGGAASFDCNEDGYQDVLLAGGDLPAKFYRNREHPWRSAEVRSRDERPRTGQRDRRLPARRRQRRRHRCRAAARRRKCRNARHGRLQFRARQRALGLQRRRCLVDGARRNLGEGRPLADRRGRQLRRPA